MFYITMFDRSLSLLPPVCYRDLKVVSIITFNELRTPREERRGHQRVTTTVNQSESVYDLLDI